MLMRSSSAIPSQFAAYIPHTFGGEAAIESRCTGGDYVPPGLFKDVEIDLKPGSESHQITTLLQEMPSHPSEYWWLTKIVSQDIQRKM